MLVAISKNILGCSKHLLIKKDKYMWSSDIPENYWIFSGKFKEKKCLDTLLKINNIDIDISLPNRYKNILNVLHIVKEEIILYRHFMGKDDWRSYIKQILLLINKNISNISTDYYNNVFLKTNNLFNFERATINIDLYNKFLLENSNDYPLKTFISENGICQPIVYDRFGTSTGRLTVKSGPHILTLKKEFRSIIKSRYLNGKIFYLDYSSLEPRIMLSLLEHKIYSDDLYTELSNKLFDGKLSRDKIKKLVLVCMYSQNKLENKNYDVIEGFLNKNKLIDIIKKNLDGSYLKTFFGRRIFIDNQSKLINYYIQSLGADIVLLGFSKIVEEIQSSSMKIHPLFLLHDAMIVDSHPDYFDKLKQIKTLGEQIPEFNNKFPIKIEEL